MGCGSSKQGTTRNDKDDSKNEVLRSNLQAEEQKVRAALESEWDTLLRGEVVSAHPLSFVSVSQHNKSDNLWIIIDGNVVNCTEFQFSHPAGPMAIVKFAGADCSDDFNRIHSRSAKSMYKNFLVGRVAETLLPTTSSEPHVQEAQNAKDEGLLSSVVIGFEKVTHNTARIQFSCGDRLRLPPGGHISIKVSNTDDVNRSYTPYLIEDTSFTMIVKSYENGVGSNYLHSLKMGDRIQYKGPLAPVFPLESGLETTYFIGGGTGIAPMYSMALAAASSGSAKQVVIVGCYRDENEVLLHNECLALQKRQSQLVSYYLVFSRSGLLEGSTLDKSLSTSFSGRISQESLKSMQPPIEKSSTVYCCGTAEFNSSVHSLVKDLGCNNVRPL